MNPTDAMNAIEGSDFAALVNVASSYKVFLRLVEGHDAVRFLLQTPNRADVLEKIAARVQALASIQSDEALEHPHDTALAVYVWILAQMSESHAKTGADLLGKIRNLHWAARVAEKAAARSITVPIAANQSADANMVRAPS